MLSDDVPKERVSVCVVDRDGEQLSCLTRVSVPDNNAIAVGTPRQLDDGPFTGVTEFAFAGAFYKDVDTTSQEGLIVGFTDLVLQGQQVLIASLLHFQWYVLSLIHI